MILKNKNFHKANLVGRLRPGTHHNTSRPHKPFVLTQQDDAVLIRSFEEFNSSHLKLGTTPSTPKLLNLIPSK